MLIAAGGLYVRVGTKVELRVDGVAPTDGLTKLGSLDCESSCGVRPTEGLLSAFAVGDLLEGVQPTDSLIASSLFIIKEARSSGVCLRWGAFL